MRYLPKVVLFSFLTLLMIFFPLKVRASITQIPAPASISVEIEKDASFSIPNIPLQDDGINNQHLYLRYSTSNNFSDSTQGVDLQVTLQGCDMKDSPASSAKAIPVFTGIDGSKPSCSVQNGLVTINAKFNTQPLNTGNEATTFYIAALTSKNQVYTPLQVSVKSAPSSSTISVSAPTSATWGESRNITINKMPNSSNQRTYTFTIAGGNTSQSFKMDLKNGSCSAKDYDNTVFSFSSPVCSNNTATVKLTFNAAKFPKPLPTSSGGFGSGAVNKTTYRLSFSEASGLDTPPLPLSSSLDLTYDESGLTLAASASRVTNNTEVSFTATGCVVGSKIDFNYTPCDTNSCKHSVDVSSGSTIYKQKLTTDNETTYNFDATCASTGTKSNSVSVIVNKQGEEKIEILPSPIPASSPITINLYGMESNQCYFYKIKDANAGTWLEPEGGRVLDGTCAEDGMDEGSGGVLGIGDTTNHRAQFYEVFNSESDTKTITLEAGLPDGAYEFQLFTPNGKHADAAGDDPHGKAPFTVGTGKLTIKAPPAPPCVTPVVAPADGAVDTGECSQINSALGILNVNISELTKTLFTLLLSISGGIILLVIIRSGYLMMFSQGNPEKVKEAQDRLTSAFIGFLFLIFALIILEVIGVDILHIPGIGA